MSAPASRNAAAEFGFLDVHVEQIRQDSHVRQTAAAQPRCRFAESVEQVRLVTIQRLVKQRDTKSRRVLAEFLQRIAEIFERLFARHVPSQRPCIEPMIAGAAHCPATSMIALTNSRAFRRIAGSAWVKRELVHDPSGAGADRRNAERVARPSAWRPQRCPAPMRSGGKISTASNPKFLRLRESIVETVGKHERSRFRFGHEGNCDRGTHGRALDPARKRANVNTSPRDRTSSTSRRDEDHLRVSPEPARVTRSRSAA